MPLTPEQVKELKKQLSAQIQNLPIEQRKEAQKQIDNMSNEAIELMLKQQTKQSQIQSQQTSEQPIFRMIISGQLPSKIIDQNKNAIAVLDIRPISPGHTIIIPKNPIKTAKNLPSSVFTLAKKIARKLSSKLKSSGSEIQTQFAFGEIIINVIPIYEKSLDINSPRQEMQEKELEKIYNKIKTKPRPIKLKRKPKSSAIKLKRRIP
jgi:diadenosine tetraphosphate (Ap4A) HIT family hydrolase